jgi:ElaB/YqjD/DUF883 family membrane-anchored ribosome-binding protein
MSTATSKKDQAQDKLNQAGDKANQAMDSAKSALSHTGEAISSAAQAAGATVDRGVSAAGSGVASAADSVRKYGPQSGMMGQATEAVASGLERGGHYVEEKGLSGMTADLGNLIKSHPIPAVLIGLGVGYLLGRALRS